MTYWLNNLQNLKCDDNFFLTLNPIYEIDRANIIKKIKYTHPYFNGETLKLQNSLAAAILNYKFQPGIKLSVDVDPISFN